QLNLEHLAPIAAYFRDVRKKYAQFEGQLKGVDSRILIAQVPGGMLTNMESQLKEQGAAERLDEVLEEIPRVRQDLGYIPLVTPTSQIVGTQAVINVLTGERYNSITKETAGVLKGEYGATPAEVNQDLQAQVLKGSKAITCRPADLLQDEMTHLTTELLAKAKEDGISLAQETVDDVLTYALFPQVGLKFLKNRHNPNAFEPAPGSETVESAAAPVVKDSVPSIETYSVKVDGQVYQVEVGPQGQISSVTASQSTATTSAPVPASAAEAVPAPLAGNIFKVQVQPGSEVVEGDVLVILEAMKMETEVRAARSGVVQELHVKEGDAVTVGAPILSLA
ncbi:biotin/lipoyl-containing protein, partial [Vibrio fujianensis]|uniref:biotin/lipoyl-containing protein n=1 Tax=Vibrio fujianensis TaxID=1974215 RepID=UPI003183A773